MNDNNLAVLRSKYDSIRKELLNGHSPWNVMELHADLDQTLIAINDILNSAPNVP